MNKYYICRLCLVDIEAIETIRSIREIVEYIGDQVERFNSTIACERVNVIEVSREEYLKEEKNGKI